jgi:hypothetical protein
MKITKAISTAGVGAAIVTGSLLAATLASAHGNGTKIDERATELAEKFNLDETEVKQYFEEKRDEHKAEHEAKAEEHLQSLVDAGTITAEQKTKLEEFRIERQTLKESLKNSDLSKEEIKAQFEAQKAEVEAWAESEGLDLEDIRPEPKEGRHGHGRHHGMDNDSDSGDSNS